MGKLLVAPRDLSDPNFAESVILLVHYAGDGTVGLVINRQTALPVSRVLRDLKGSSNNSQPVYAGGPVEIDVVQALAQLPAGPHDAAHLFGKLYLISEKPELEKALAAPKGSGGLRIYLGYCGWVPGQLESEVSQGGWHIFDGTEALSSIRSRTRWSNVHTNRTSSRPPTPGKTPVFDPLLM